MYLEFAPNILTAFKSGRSEHTGRPQLEMSCPLGKPLVCGLGSVEGLSNLH